MTLPFLRLPLRIHEAQESVAVVDAAETIVSYTYYEDEPGRRLQTKRVTKAEAIELAQTIARAVTERLEDEEPNAGG